MIVNVNIIDRNRRVEVSAGEQLVGLTIRSGIGATCGYVYLTKAEASQVARALLGASGKNTELSMTKEQLEAMTEDAALEATEGMTEHPEGYEGPCACNLCVEYSQ